MKILILGNTFLTSDLKSLGHEVVNCSLVRKADLNLELDRAPVSISEVFSALPAGFETELVLLCDESSLPLFLGLECLEIPTVWYPVDTHLHEVWHRVYASVFDYIFVAQRESLPVYARNLDRQLVGWLPLFCPSVSTLSLDLERDLDFCFVGTLDRTLNPSRAELIERLRERIPIHARSGSYREIFNRSKIALNQSVAGDLNFRTFEIMACGALLLTERIGNGLDELLRDGEHLVLYDKGDADQIAELASYYLAHPAEREAIAENGQREVRRAHGGIHRAQRILEVLERDAIHTPFRVERRLAVLPEIQREMVTLFEFASKVYGARAETAANRAPFYRNMGGRFNAVAAAMRSASA